MHPLSVLQIHHIFWYQVCLNFFLSCSRHWDLVAMSVPRVQLLPEDFVQLHPPGPNGVNSHSPFGPRFESQPDFSQIPPARSRRDMSCSLKTGWILQGWYSCRDVTAMRRCLKISTSSCQVDLHEDPRRKKEKKERNAIDSRQPSKSGSHQHWIRWL